VVVGHGVRVRQMRGPVTTGGPPQEITYRVRRFRCRRCTAVLSVGPPEALRYRLFSLVAIVWAIALYGIERVSSRGVRRRISPWRIVGSAAELGWQSLRRWLHKAGSGELLPYAQPVRGSPREIAARLSYVLVAKAPPHFAELSIAEQAVQGALHAAMGITPCADRS
jgi:hypothetical protein